MSTRVLRNITPWNTLPGPSRTPARLLHHSLPRASAGAVSPSTSLSSALYEYGLRDYRLTDLVESLRANSVPNRIWASYQAVLAGTEPSSVPLVIHQHVLRKCTPSFMEARKSAARRVREESRELPVVPHIYENRFRAVINNIRSSGGCVELDDFHFILRQFAAVGYHIGSEQVLTEIPRHGIAPTAKTYGFVLQAVAHRLRLPILVGREELTRQQASKTCINILTRMSREQVPISSGIMDLAVRILRETSNPEGFDFLIKTAYGIDLDNPARNRMGFASLTETGSSASQSSSSALPPHPFSTAALNTIVDTLGRTGRISKLVQAYEVLTHPLPPPRIMTEEERLEMDEDEDDGDEDIPWSPPLPHATPNSTTYKFLVKWTSQAGNSTLARHFVTEAMEADRLADRELRGNIHLNIPLADIATPRVAVTRGMLMPLLHLANQEKQVWLLRWLARICNALVRRKTVHVAFYQDWVRRLHDQGLHEPLPAILTDVHGARRYLAELRKSEVEQGIPRPRSFQDEVPVLEVDLDGSVPEPVTEKKRPFNPAVHIAILQQDLYDLSELERHILDHSLGLTIQRVKENLGRRVWANKDIYLRDQDARVKVPKESWPEKVNFKSKGFFTRHIWETVWSEELMEAPKGKWPKRDRSSRRAGPLAEGASPTEPSSGASSSS